MVNHQKMPVLAKLARWWVIPAILLLACLLVLSATNWAYRNDLGDLAATGQARLTLYDGTLREALSRYAFLPYVLAQNSNVQQLLAFGRSPENVDHYLENLNEEAGAEAFFIMNADGDTLASSNWRDELTYVGHNYAFRPYFLATRNGETGRFFAVGATTGRPGYFFSQPVFVDQRNVGAAIVKVNLRPLQRGWQEGGENVLVSDGNGVIFLSSRNDWNYQTLKELSAEQRRYINTGKQYGKHPLKPVGLKMVEQLAEHQQIVEVEGVRYLALSRPLGGLGWDMYHLAPLEPVYRQTRLVAVNGSVIALLAFALTLYLRERRYKEQSRRREREAENVRAVNIRLQAEIDEHNRTENTLRETQNELIQAGKLAALGHMAAGIVHELNQPVSAIKTNIASCRLLLQRERYEQLDSALVAIKGTTEHMATITAQLKSFAHKSPQQLEPIIVQNSLDEVLSMTEGLLREHRVELSTTICDKPMVVNCHRGRIKQVLLNLIRNAVDAMDQVEERKLNIMVEDWGKDVQIAVADSGMGISDQVAEELFTPFVTTKDVGNGLGLGLSICNRIVADLGGTIKAYNNPTGGACFVVSLPSATDEVC